MVICKKYNWSVPCCTERTWSQPNWSDNRWNQYFWCTKFYMIVKGNKTSHKLICQIQEANCWVVVFTPYNHCNQSGRKTVLSKGSMNTLSMKDCLLPSFYSILLIHFFIFICVVFFLGCWSQDTMYWKREDGERETAGVMKIK